MYFGNIQQLIAQSPAYQQFVASQQQVTQQPVAATPTQQPVVQPTATQQPAVQPQPQQNTVTASTNGQLVTPAAVPILTQSIKNLINNASQQNTTQQPVVQQNTTQQPAVQQNTTQQPVVQPTATGISPMVNLGGLYNLPSVTQQNQNTTGTTTQPVNSVLGSYYQNIYNSPAFQQWLQQQQQNNGGSNNNNNSPDPPVFPSTTINGQTVQQYNSGQVTSPTMPTGTNYTPVNQQMQPNEAITGAGSNLSGNGQQVQAQPVQQPQAFDPALMQAFINQLPQDVQAQIGQLSQQAQVQAQTGTASPEFNQALTALQNTLNNTQFDPRASVKYNYEQLMDFNAGETPAWAAGAMRTAMQTMAARGIDASTMAGEAVSTALMQAALPIASQDAQIFNTWQLSVLDKKQQVGVLRASHLANLDITNLNNRQQAAVVNAQSFLQMDMTNLSNRQQAAIVSSQQRLQQMLSNQAAENVARQVNTESINQVDMFFAELGSRINQFNSAQSLDVQQFNSQLRDSREKFNAQNALLIEQANVQYLRQINTANTAEQNKANYINSQNLLEISNTAMANALTLFRDRNAYIFQESENVKERALRRILAEMDIDARLQIANKQAKYNTGVAIGGLISDIAGSIFDSIFDDD